MTSNFFRLVEPGDPDTRIKFLYEYTLVPRWLLCPLMWKLSLFYHNWNFAPPAGEQSVGSEISFFGCPPPPDCTDGNHQHWQGPLPPPDTPETSPHHLTPYLPLQNIPLTPPPGTPASSTIFTNYHRRVPKQNNFISNIIASPAYQMIVLISNIVSKSNPSNRMVNRDVWICSLETSNRPLNKVAGISG